MTKLPLEVEQHNEKGLAYWHKQGFIDVAAKKERIGIDAMAVVAIKKSLR